jgi:hypothetical protein
MQLVGRSVGLRLLGPAHSLKMLAADEVFALKAKLGPSTLNKCPACNGTGFPTVVQPVQPGRKNLSCSL